MAFPRHAGKPCGSCGALFRPDRPARRFCSRQCAADARPRASRVAAGRKGGLAKRKTPTDWAAIATLSPVEAFKLGRSVRKAWIGNRMQRAYRMGYSRGYEDGYEYAVKGAPRAKKVA